MSTTANSKKDQVKMTRSSLAMHPALFSGAVAGVVADSLLHPMDTINLRMKVQRNRNASITRTLRTIIREEGIRGYYSGVSMLMIYSPIAAAVYFGTYETCKEKLTPLVSERYQSVVHFATGAISELVMSTVSVPGEVIRSRMQLGCNPHRASGGAIKYTSNYRNPLHAVSSICRSEGPRGLYSGYSAYLSVGMCTSAFFMTFYEGIKKNYMNYIIEKEGHARDLKTYESLAGGGIAGGCAAFLTNPLDVVMVRLMTQGKDKRYHGVRHCFMETLKQEKIRGLWKGASARTCTAMPGAGICFSVYETIKRIVFHPESDEEFDLVDTL